MLKRILIGLGSEPFASTAIRYGVELAARHDAVLTGVTIVDVQRLSNLGPLPLGASGVADELRAYRFSVSQQHIAQTVANFRAACIEAHVRHDVRQEEGNPLELISSLARYYDLVILGLRHIFEYGVLGESVNEPTDLLIRLIGRGVRPIVAVAEEHRPVRRALVAYSGSMESAKTLKRFVQLRPLGDVAMRLLHVGGDEQQAEVLLTDAAEYCRAHGFEPETQWVAGSPKEQLLRQATEYDADLIVMGNSARNLLLRHLFGETALHVIQHTDRALFLSQ